MDGLDSVTTSSTPSPDPVADASQAESPLGAAGALTGVVLWAVGNVIIAGGPMTGLTLAFWRSWIAVAVYAIVLYGRGGRLHRKDLTHSASLRSASAGLSAAMANISSCALSRAS